MKQDKLLGFSLKDKKKRKKTAFNKVRLNIRGNNHHHLPKDLSSLFLSSSVLLMKKYAMIYTVNCTDAETIPIAGISDLGASQTR